MKFAQLIEYNLTDIFFGKSYTKCGGKLFQKPKLSISLDQLSKVLYSLFLLYAKLRTIEI